MNREDFPIINTNIIYLDNGATTLKPMCVIDSTIDYYSNYSANAHRGDYDISLKVDINYEGVREKVAQLINCNSNEVIFTSGSTDSSNLVVDGYFRNKLKKDDEVLITYSEHASNVLPWFNLENEIGIKVNFIPLDENKHVTIDNVINSITDNTKVISLAHVTNVLGDIRPIKEICEVAHKRGIKVVVDGAQSVPHIKTDVKDLDLDFLFFSAHKMCGPTGVGVLYGKYELLEDMKPMNLGGGMNESFDDAEHIELKRIPTRFEGGTPNIAGVIAFGEAIDYLLNIGFDNITKREKELNSYLTNKLSEINFIHIVSNSDTGITAFTVDGLFPQDVAIYLNKYNICVRAGNHCAKLLKNVIGTDNTIRVSLYFYNTIEEIDKLVDLLRDKNKIMKEMI